VGGVWFGVVRYHDFASRLPGKSLLCLLGRGLALLAVYSDRAVRTRGHVAQPVSCTDMRGESLFVCLMCCFCRCRSSAGDAVGAAGASV